MLKANKHTIVSFGKHKGLSISDIAGVDLPYLGWAIENHIIELDDVDLTETALEEYHAEEVGWKLDRFVRS